MNELGRPKKRSGLFSNMQVAHQIYLLVFTPLLLLVLIGASTIYVLDKNQLTLDELGSRVDLLDTGNQIIRASQRDYTSLLHRVAMGSTTWEDGLQTLSAAEKNLREVTIPHYRTLKEAATQGNHAQTATFRKTSAELDKLLDSMQKSMGLLSLQDRNKLDLYLGNDLLAETSGAQANLEEELKADVMQSSTALEVARGNARRFLILAMVMITGGILLTVLLGALIYVSISSRISRLVSTIRDISAGDLNARVAIEGRNELAELGQAFDSMVEERISTQRKINADHQQLNESVFSLLEAVADLSERNLTVRATVTEDATGPLADAINQLAEDTTEVLKQVRGVALSVESSSQEVNQYALSVNQLALLEREEAEETVAQLERILQRLGSIAELARQANQMADTTSQATLDAQQSVSRTVRSISGIRDTVQETGKRLKRLGERSQEISRIVDIIGTISERTTVLALNASMQATAAGEAGRGFSVIAEEIQHLAETSRESTEQIGVLVRNIQQEANTTIGNMDQTISAVVDGSNLADHAAQQMQASLDATIELVNSVGQIASDSAEQVSISKDLQLRAGRIVEATQSTGRELLSLTTLTKNMTEYAQMLVKSVKVFKLEA